MKASVSVSWPAAIFSFSISVTDLMDMGSEYSTSYSWYVRYVLPRGITSGRWRRDFFRPSFQSFLLSRKMTVKWRRKGANIHKMVSIAQYVWPSRPIWIININYNTAWNIL